MSKSPDYIDQYVGSRIRLRRMLKDMSQEKLGEYLNLTFQQIQKYEKGSNRVGAGRLYVIARILSVPVQFFYEGLPVGANGMKNDIEESVGLSGLAENKSEAFSMEFVSSSEGLQLNKAFQKIVDTDTRKSIVELVKMLGRIDDGASLRR